MRKWSRVISLWGLSAALVCGLAACAAKGPMKGPKAAAEALEPTAMPTVPPAAPTPAPGTEAEPLPTRAIPKPVKAKKGELIGPEITFFGAAHADGTVVDPTEVDSKGIPTYNSIAGSGFIIVVEGKPGKSGGEVGRQIFKYVPDDPTARPDLEIESNRDLGNGSREVCDRRKPNIGGIPGIKPTSFAETQKISDALNDLSCRFETFIESDSSCTMDKNGDYKFAKPDTTTQFCMIVARAWGFPEGETLLTVRLRDEEGNPGPSKQMRIRRTLGKPPKKK